MWTCRLLFFGNYPSLNRVCMCCHWIKKPKFNDVCVLFKHSNFFSRMLEIHSKRPKFQNFFPGNSRLCGEFVFLLHLLQSFCHLLKILLKTLGGSGGRVVKSSQLLAKITAYLVSIGQLLCLAFLCGWRFLNKISLDWFDNSAVYFKTFWQPWGVVWQEVEFVHDVVHSWDMARGRANLAFHLISTHFLLSPN